MTTSAELVRAALKESSASYQRYWDASSLPRVERFKNKPAAKKYRRDRVLWKLLRLNMSKAVNDAVTESLNNGFGFATGGYVADQKKVPGPLQRDGL